VQILAITQLVLTLALIGQLFTLYYIKKNLDHKYSILYKAIIGIFLEVSPAKALIFKIIMDEQEKGRIKRKGARDAN